MALTTDGLRSEHAQVLTHQDDLLNQLTADICGITVKTGPVEATLFGNIAVQAISAGVVANLTEARALIEKSFTSKVFQPA